MKASRTAADRRGLGRWGEALAADQLAAFGYTLLAQNFRSIHTPGEADIVAADGEVLVIAEVKTRRSEAFGTPLESITPRKAARLAALLEAWRLEHPGAPPGSRIDVIGIVLRPGAAPQIAVVKNAVETNGIG
jgi:putative endonuclease